MHPNIFNGTLISCHVGELLDFEYPVVLVLVVNQLCFMLLFACTCAILHMQDEDLRFYRSLARLRDPAPACPRHIQVDIARPMEVQIETGFKKES